MTDEGPFSPAHGTEDGASIGGLVRDATTHLSTLVRAEVELAKGEVTAEVKKGIKGSAFFIVALTILLFSLFFFFVAVAEAIAYAGLGQAASFGIVFGLMVLLALLFLLVGFLKVRTVRGPKRTISSVKETVARLRTRTKRE
jgi:positive regulator of sigma E activity